MDNRCASAANGRSIGFGQLKRKAAIGVLGDGDKVWNAASIDKFITDCVTRRLGCNHDNIKIAARRDLAIVNGKPMTKGKGCAFFDIGLNIFAVDFRLQLVWREDHDNIRAFDRVSCRFRIEPVGFNFLICRAVRAQTNNDVNAAIV